jgi:hypothetical protein
MPQELKWEHMRNGAAAARWHHRRAMKGILPEDIRLEKRRVHFDPVIQRCLTGRVIREWLAKRETLHVVERGYVERGRFLAALEDVQQSLKDGFLLPLLCVEGFLRALAPGGEMLSLVPPRSTEDSMKC